MTEAFNTASTTLLDGKVVIVTGAGGGVGEGIAKLAASRGARVVVNDLGVSLGGDGGDASPARRVADEIVAAGGIAIPSFRTISEWDSAQGIIQDALDAFGQIDVVVNNAGILRDVLFHKMEPSDWDLVRHVNLDGYFYVSRAAAPYFRQQASGVYLHMTSTSGLVGNLAQTNYGAAKLGVAGLSRNIAIDMARFNVRSNCIAPFAFTRMVNSIPETNERNRKRQEVNRRLDPAKIANLAVALMSEEAKDISGQIFGSRNNEIFIFSQPRPVRTVHTAEGWTPESCLESALPALRASTYPLDTSADVFTWDPI